LQVCCNKKQTADKVLLYIVLSIS